MVLYQGKKMDDIWIPGRVSLARNDDPIPGTVNLIPDTGPPAEPGVYLRVNCCTLQDVIGAFRRM
jgi:hypothetical protein